jgi:hypothetical protein
VEDTHVRFKARLLGLAFTSPAVVVAALDRKTFECHFYDPSLTPTLLEARSSLVARKLLIFLKSTHDLVHMQETVSSDLLRKASALLLFDNPEVLSLIEGMTIMDLNGSSRKDGWKHISFSAEEFIAQLSADIPRVRVSMDPQDIKRRSRKLSESITLQEIANRIAEPLSEELGEEVKKNICMYVAALIPKDVYRKKVLAAARDAGHRDEDLIELNKYAEFSKEFEALLRSYYEHVELGTPKKMLKEKYGRFLHISDLKFMFSYAPPVKGQKYFVDHSVKNLKRR